LDQYSLLTNGIEGEPSSLVLMNSPLFSPVNVKRKFAGGSANDPGGCARR
jgi:hypothetical protein